MHPQSFSPSRKNSPDTAEVDAAERKIGAVLADLEQTTDGEVDKLQLDDVVDMDETGQPVLKKAVDISLRRRSKRQWSR